MKIYLENFDNQSDSGPNGFTRKLFTHLVQNKSLEISDYEHADVSFCLIQTELEKKKPRILRLDGIYFNIDQDFVGQNQLIQKTYHNSDAVVFQTEFNKNLIQNWFGQHRNGTVIRNGTDFDLISRIPPLQHQLIDKYREVWTCAASWRPHKRLDEIIRYFLEFSTDDCILIIMGKNAEQWLVSHPRVVYAGHVTWEQQISICKRSTKFLHLAWLDHCPNVVVDARASGCSIVCSSTGGTKEVAGKDATLIDEEEWDFKPTKLYQPPRMNFHNVITNKYNVSIDLKDTSSEYINVFNGFLR